MPTQKDDTKLKAACARLTAGITQGTGFLVSAERLLTCNHVILEARQGLIVVDFPHGRYEARVEHVDTINDCALLLLDRQVPASDAQPLSLSQGRAPKGATWQGYGFPSVAGHGGLLMDGRVQDPQGQDQALRPALVLQSDNITSGSQLEGFSGSPVLVDGTVVGQMRTIIPDEAGRAQMSIVYACPADLFTDLARRGVGAVALQAYAYRGLRVVWAIALGIVALIATYALLSPPQVNGWLREEPSDFLQAEVLPDGQEAWAVIGGSLLHSTDGARTWSQAEGACAACGFWLVRGQSQPRVVCCEDRRLEIYYDSGVYDGRALLEGRIRNIVPSPDGLTAWATRDGMSNKGITPVEIRKTTDRGENFPVIASHSNWGLWDHLITARRDGRRLFGYPPSPQQKPGAAAPGTAILASDNDGRDWHPVLQVEGLAINQIASSSFTVCAVGRQIYRSEDGGSKWQQVNSVPPATLWDVQSVNDGDFWAAGDDGILLRSTDRCQTWTLIPTHSNASFRIVRVVEGGNKVFLFGDNRTVRVSTDGGNTWRDPLLKGPPCWYYPVSVAFLMLALCGLYVGFRRMTPRPVTAN